MTTQTEALKLALERYMAAYGQALEAHGIELQQQQIEADKCAREALAQPVHECTRSHPHENMSRECELLTEIARLQNKLAQPKEHEHMAISELKRLADAIELHVETRAERMVIADKLRNLAYTTPPQRTWVGLTDDEMWNAYAGGSDIINLDYAKAIEAKLKEKNT